MMSQAEVDESCTSQLCQEECETYCVVTFSLSAPVGFAHFLNFMLNSALAESLGYS